MTETGQEWARIIQQGAPDRAVCAIISAVNAMSAEVQANRAAIIVACAQVLAQNITGEPTLSSEVRAGILALVDGFAMQSAIEEAEHGG
jgi:hypothetical protein